MKFIKLSIFVLVFSAFAVSANAQSVKSLQRELDRLRDDVESLQRSSYRSGDIKTEVGGDLYVKMTHMEETFRSANGKMDELEYKLKTLNDKIEMINKDMDVRFKMLEEKLASQELAAAATIETNKPKAEIKSGSVEELYQKGLEAVKTKDSETAIKVFNKILTDSPTHKLAGNAQYWLGETYYSQKDFKRAAIAFGKGYENYKSGTKGADSLLKLGMTMVELKDPKNACLAFVNLPKEFPKATQDLKNKAANQAKKHSCK